MKPQKLLVWLALAVSIFCFSNLLQQIENQNSSIKSIKAKIVNHLDEPSPEVDSRALLVDLHEEIGSVEGVGLMNLFLGVILLSLSCTQIPLQQSKKIETDTPHAPTG